MTPTQHKTKFTDPSQSDEKSKHSPFRCPAPHRMISSSSILPSLFTSRPSSNFFPISHEAMPYSNSTAASSDDDDEEDKGKNFGPRISAPISISSRLSFSAPRGSPALSPASSTNGNLGGAVFEPKITKKSRRKAWYKKRVAIGLAVLLACFFLMNWWMICRIQEAGRRRGGIKMKSLKSNSTTVFIRVSFDLSSPLFLCYSCISVVFELAFRARSRCICICLIGKIYLSV